MRGGWWFKWLNNAGVSLRDNRTDNRRKRGFDQNENEIQKILIRFYGSCNIGFYHYSTSNSFSFWIRTRKIPFEQQYAELKDVQDSLDPNEIVKANDIELSYGQEFDVEVDLSGIEGVDESKIKILFHEAKNEAGTDFDTHTPDTYKAVYAVEPVSGHPAYRVSRNITVKEPKTEAITTSNSSENTTVKVMPEKWRILELQMMKRRTGRQKQK